MEKCKQHWMLNTGVKQLILAMTLPLLPAIFLLVSFDLLETCLVSKSGTQALAALAFSAPLTITLAAVAIAASITTNNWICKTVSSDKSALRHNILAALVANSALVLLLSVAFYLLTPWIFQLLGVDYAAIPATFHQGARPDLAPWVNEYTRLRFIGWVFLALIWQVNGVFRSLGYVHQASWLLSGWMLSKMLMAAAVFYDLIPVNLTAGTGQDNPLLAVAQLHLLSDTLFALISVFTLMRKFSLTPDDLRAVAWLHTIKQLSAIGFGALFQQGLTPLSIGLLTLIIAGLGADKVAAFGIVIRIEALALLLPVAFTASLPGLIAANWWAGEIKRVKALISSSFMMLILTQLVVALLLFFAQHSISSKLSQDIAVQEGITFYLTWVPLSFIGSACVMVAMSCFNAMGCKSTAAILGFNAKILILLPLALLGSLLFDFHGLFIGISIANFLMVFIAWLAMINFIDKHRPSDFSSALAAKNNKDIYPQSNCNSPAIKPES
ncbi:MATE family efflux transporter [Thalassomonas haliotis]|uniref:Multidrug transporter MatE n=1 Tax=Thalassomonas haliotis TaxID=485448 RepID=A0ABY7V9K4_9GAMM|nr:MATE family efflux transporter [Thalassomonas haliotis]WDE09960.1 hypothetical protein H3N35_16825 [Thalassomonas haliotis]